VILRVFVSLWHFFFLALKFGARLPARQICSGGNDAVRQARLNKIFYFGTTCHLLRVIFSHYSLV